ncbi:hypothetical protein L228DRAFT_247381 [Xylona heveae TC161]|uniref:Uncharacterized protein n=1 Tax=Xylona heveae (strain CBS 132557 / TC161) TaxID=1328760 RepID=A0A165H404_XYLHT|nr:hypothetical protein L228DRAFT_247381 [Xylona heveae TC161]KZF22955.1 hypothetical protein L228DRAFT_247381 [Xylona heveae TC161]
MAAVEAGVAFFGLWGGGCGVYLLAGPAERREASCGAAAHLRLCAVGVFDVVSHGLCRDQVEAVPLFAAKVAEKEDDDDGQEMILRRRVLQNI